MADRLLHSASAYLRQHAHNPVDWWPWGEAAFAEARRRDVPVFISIGYAACHWCHVMAAESFEDEATAALLNEYFVSIKVDREEHPEVDEAYMAATQALTGQGGWPMSVFTVPDGKVFHAGTYFPPQRMGQVPSFREVCQAVWEAWNQRREQVEAQAAKIAEALGTQRRQQGRLATVVEPDESGSGEDADRPGSTTDLAVWTSHGFGQLRDQALVRIAEQEDTVHGGFSAAPKFPPSPLLEWLLQEPAGFALAQRCMLAMARSALFDQVEGGFARYTVDRAWQLPHFEKMLYDNAQLLGAYARLSAHPQADAATVDAAAKTAKMTVDWMQQRMLTAEGVLASSLDADTHNDDGERVEGATYLFSDTQLQRAASAAGLGDTEAQRFVELNRGVPADEHALRSGSAMNVTADTPRTLHFDQALTGEDQQLWETVLPQLQQMRAQRQQPTRDEKVVAVWNAMAVRSLVQAATLWEDPELLLQAEAIAERLWQIHAEVHQGPPPRDNQRYLNEVRAGFSSVQGQVGGSAKIYRTSYHGAHSGAEGTLADHVQVASMCFALASAGAGELEWVDRGASVLRFVLNEFLKFDGDSLQVVESLDADGLLAQVQDGAAEASPIDGPEPSSIAALAEALQAAEALGVSRSLPWIMPARLADRPQQWQPLRPAELLQHLPVLAAEVPTAVGASLAAARRAVMGSPAFRVVSGTQSDISTLRRSGVLLGIPVEPLSPEARVGEDQPFQVSVCLNQLVGGVCLAPSSSIDDALDALRAAQT